MPQLIGQVSRIEIERRVEFASLPEGWAAVGLLVLGFALLWAIVWMYRREGRAGASPRVRGVMAVLRCVVVASLLAVYLQPVLATYLHRWIDSYTLVLVDTSASMDLQDRYRSADEIARVASVVPEAGQTPVRRVDVVGELLETGDRRLLRDLAKRNRVRVCTFSDAPKTEYTIRAAREADFVEVTGEKKDGDDALVSKPGAWRTRFAAQGASTDVSRAVRETVEALGRSPVAGIVLLTDGGFNRGESAGAVARYARDRRIPLHVVGIGDPSPPRNVRVAELIAPENVFAEDPFAIVTQITHQGMAGEEVTVELLERRADSEDVGRVVASRTVRLGSDQAVEPLTFQHRQGAVGRYVYRVQIPPGETESVTDDNARQQTVNVIENKLRVLLVAGAPSWDYRYLARLLQRDATFELSCWLQSADDQAVRDGDVIIDHFPASPEELFAYDAVLLLDPDPLEFTPEVAENLARLVTEHGGGLLYAAARLYTPGFVRDPATAAITRILPVTFDPEADLILNQIGHYQRVPHPLWIEPSAAGHPILRLPPSAKAYNWSAIGDVYWHYPVLRAKPVATVLMRHGDPRMENDYGRHVLFATQYVGAGRTAFLGFDGTWRWRAAHEAIFNKFWVQTVRYLVEGKLAGGNRRGTILTEKDAYPLGEAIPITARLFDARFAPLQIESVVAEYQLDGTTVPFTLRRLADRPGWYEGRIAPAHTGGCELRLPIPGGELGTEVARREIQIVRPNLEILDPRMDRERLVAMAEQSAGGRYYDVGEALKMAEAIPDRHESTTIRSRPLPLWDDAWVFAILVGLLLTEWTMRKVFRLL